METLRFQDLPFSKEIHKAVADMGFEEMTPIQTKTIPPILAGKDVIGQAQTGTGKTMAFGIPIIEAIKPRNKHTQAIILCPTRELAIQVSEEIKRVSKYRKDINILPVYGGQPIERQLRVLQTGVDIVIGTPGRTIDHINRGTLKLKHVRVVVLDEADEMLNMGFMEDVETILETVPADRQTLLFSATMPQPILNLTNRFMRNPEFLKVVHKELTVPNVEQIYFETRESMKPEVLSRVIDMYGFRVSLAFCNTKKKVDEVVMELQARGYLAEGLHGDMTQAQRDRVMGKFRRASLEILVATDVAARGLDVGGVEAVFNYDLPQDDEYYVHRIGRTARAGKRGYAFTFVVGREVYKLREIERYAHTKIKREAIPSLADVEENRSVTVLEKIKERIEEGGLDKYTRLVERLAEEDYSTLDIAAALLKMTLGAEGKEQADVAEGFSEKRSGGGITKLYLSVGRRHNVGAKDILGAVAGETGLPGKLIGKIDIREKFTLIEVPTEYAHDVLTMMKDRYIKGNKIAIEPAQGKGK
ncbi:MAG: DEAD-box ATP-dependent RNA helicase CshA [Syntrophorhabdus sp. PtaU1.Bin050]|jgi:ATP-dependent RNA helicase DeaD|nr:MAG: DEAD-box ATP-dependent RNA helicase CshA [Syntrophorhabdus sp. PtaU1.Bin050]